LQPLLETGQLVPGQVRGRRHDADGPYHPSQVPADALTVSDGDGRTPWTPPIVSTFRELFGAEPDVMTDAPGRANLMGEHTDYSGGFVLPVTIPRRTRVELRRRPDDVVQVHSEHFGRMETFRLGTEAPRRDWVDHVQGVTALARPRALGGFDARIDSAVPPG